MPHLVVQHHPVDRLTRYVVVESDHFAVSVVDAVARRQDGFLVQIRIEPVVANYKVKWFGNLIDSAQVVAEGPAVGVGGRVVSVAVDRLRLHLERSGRPLRFCAESSNRYVDPTTGRPERSDMSRGAEAKLLRHSEVRSSDEIQASVGSSVGSSEGSSVGSSDGCSVGSSVGSSVGPSVGSSLGSSVGSSLGSSLGCSVGSLVLQSNAVLPDRIDHDLNSSDCWGPHVNRSGEVVQESSNFLVSKKQVGLRARVGSRRVDFFIFRQEETEIFYDKFVSGDLGKDGRLGRI